MGYVLTGLTIKFSFKLIDLQPRMFSENRSDSKEMGNKLLNNNIFVRKCPGTFGGVLLCWKTIHGNGSKCLFRGLFLRNSLLNQPQGEVICLFFSYVFQEGNLKTACSHAWESSKGCHQSCVEYWKNGTKRQVT